MASIPALSNITNNQVGAFEHFVQGMDPPSRLVVIPNPPAYPAGADIEIDMSQATRNDVYYVTDASVPFTINLWGRDHAEGSQFRLIVTDPVNYSNVTINTLWDNPFEENPQGQCTIRKKLGSWYIDRPYFDYTFRFIGGTWI